MPRSFILTALLVLCFTLGQSQDRTQKVRGKVIDKESHQPLAGANILIEKTLPMMGASTDADGEFVIQDVPVGRHNIAISYLGYQPILLTQVQVISGKQLVLEIELTESMIELEELVVEANKDKSAAMNEMAFVSARGFSVEETSRYASSLFDPARMAKNLAGVSVAGGSSDLFNEIIVRGNSPRGVLWRLEGIEIPNPNHFGALGNTGGGISMLSSSTLANSDFYTGAFPAEFGNATSGVFDLNFRKGNNQGREYSFMAGFLGIETAMEGPFSKNCDASYLVNLRYSTLALLEAAGLNPAGDVLPRYGDMSFNIHVPTEKAGQFSLFGLGGANNAYFEPSTDTSEWESDEDGEGFDDRQLSGVVGLTHKFLLTDNSYIRTVLSGSVERWKGEGYFLDPENDLQRVPQYKDDFENLTFRLSSTYTQKIDARQTIKVGFTVSHQSFDFYAQDYDEDSLSLVTLLANNGSASQLQLYGQWKYRLSEDLLFAGGIHYNYSGLNSHQSIEPRLALKWDVNERHSLSAAFGLHSKPENSAFYYVGGETTAEVPETPNFDLDYTKSLHSVVGYNWRISNTMRIHAEAYHQYLFDVPVQNDLDSYGSMINVLDIWDAVYAGPMVNGGEGRNIGLDLTIEKNYARNYYILLACSIFDSKYTTLSGEEFNTRFSSKYQANLLAGKEWPTGKTRDNVFGINLKFVLNGGDRTTPIDLEASREGGYTVRFDERTFTESIGTYYRVDAGISYKINKPRVTHTISLDIQNATNRLNPFYNYYGESADKILYAYHTGLFPVVNYRIEF